MNVKRLKDLREDKDKSQSDIAKILKITQQQYSLYETGLRLIPIDKLCILADYYKTSTDYILGRTNTK
ncbi:MAG TPA: transcriptional regulator [Firmicutes bacterium]|mgnify:FL=1|jgi:transcriptional regulator with XRE-family HTH domain|nr:transcriptional regulator [Bacillota bacterium]